MTRAEEFEEPLPGNPHQEPEPPAEPADSSLTAALLLLERLSPLERAVVVLREVFGCSVCEIASAVGCSEATCHQLIAASTGSLFRDRNGKILNSTSPKDGSRKSTWSSTRTSSGTRIVRPRPMPSIAKRTGLTEHPC